MNDMAGADDSGGEEEEESTWAVCEPVYVVAEQPLPWEPRADDVARWRERGCGSGLPGRAGG